MRFVCKTSSQVRHRRRSAVTLIELLIVILLLGLLAAAVIPSASHVMSAARDNDVQARLLESWMFARTLAQARNEPTMWVMRQDGSDVAVSVRPALSDESFRSFCIEACTIEPGDAQISTSKLERRALLQPHGVSETLVFRVRRAERSIEVTLPGVIESNNFASAVGVQ